MREIKAAILVGDAIHIKYGFGYFNLSVNGFKLNFVCHKDTTISSSLPFTVSACFK